jgi:hypothetical protein
MSSDFMHRLAAQPYQTPEIPEHVLWRLAKHGRVAEARMRVVPIGSGRPELRIYVQHPTPEFQLGLSPVVKTNEKLDVLARQQRQLFEPKGLTAVYREDA